MSQWVYEARDGAGKIVQGAYEAPDRRSALEFLRGQGLFLTKLEVGRGVGAVPVPRVAPLAAPQTTGNVERPVDAQRGPVNVPPPRPKAISSGVDPNLQTPRLASTPIVPQPLLRTSSKDLSIFFRQTGAMIHAGTSIGAAMHSMAESAPNKALRQAAAQIERRAMSGEPMSESMRAYPGLFSPLQIGMVSAGERGGFLDRIFNRLTVYAERDYDLQQTIKRETWYPKLLVFASILIPGAVPLVLAVVQGGQNPFVAWIRSVGPPLVFVGMAYAIYRAIDYSAPLAMHNNPFKLGLDTLKLRLPIIGKVTRGLATSKFCRAFGALISAGVSAGESVRLASDACGNAAIAKSGLEAIPRLERGESITEALKVSGHFPSMVMQMLKVGEDSGNIDEQLDKAADFLENDSEMAIRQAVQVMGILVFLLIAIRIGMQVASFYLGYFDSIFKMAEG